MFHHSTTQFSSTLERNPQPAPLALLPGDLLVEIATRLSSRSDILHFGLTASIHTTLSHARTDV
jgi:hypothetical protein